MSVITQAENSALIDAARCGKTEVIVELAKAGVDLNQQDKVCHCMYVIYMACTCT